MCKQDKNAFVFLGFLVYKYTGREVGENFIKGREKKKNQTITKKGKNGRPGKRKKGREKKLSFQLLFFLSAPGGALGPLTASSAAPLSTSLANPLAPWAAPAAIVSMPLAAASAGCVSGSSGNGPRASSEAAAAEEEEAEAAAAAELLSPSPPSFAAAREEAAAVVEAAASRSEDQSTVLQTRIKGEKSVRLELAHRLGGLQRSHQHWTVCLDEIETDLLSASGILAFAAEFRDPSRFMA